MIDKIKASKAVEITKLILSSKYFAFVTALITVLFYYLGLELVTIYYLALTGALIFLFCDDLTPFMGHLLFAFILMSPKHTPSTAHDASSDFIFRTPFKVQAAFLIVILGGAVIFRLVCTLKAKKFTPTPSFISLAVFCFILLFNGAASHGYTPKNILYAVALAGCFLGMYAILKDNIVWSKETFERLAFIFLAFACALLLEEAVIYATAENPLLPDGSIDRSIFVLGWGVYNTLACLMLFCLPFTLYLAGRKKFGFLYLVFSIIFAIGIVFSMSRQGMVTVVLIYPSCLIALLLKGKNRIANSITVGAAVVTGIILLCVFHEQIFALLPSSSDNNKFAVIFIGLMSASLAGLCALCLLCKNKKINLGVLGGVIAVFVIAALITRDETEKLVGAFMEESSGRNYLWEQAIRSFEAFPAFGVGFYRDLAQDPGSSGLSFIPDMYHNTIAQLLGACGVFAFIAYLAHRAITVYYTAKKPTAERLTIAVSALGMLISCLFDNHIFYLTGTLVYSALLAYFDKAYYATEDICSKNV